MEMIGSKRDFIEALKDLLAVERHARNDYVQDIDLFKDKELVETIEKIKIDEDKHILIIEDLIEMLSK